jgi:general stress protein YciG
VKRRANTPALVQRSQDRLRPISPRSHELAVGVPAPQRDDEPEIRRDDGGRVADPESAAELGRRGGETRAGQVRLARRVSLGESFADPRFEPYGRAAKAFRRLHVARLARDVGGGSCGPAPASIVASAALQLAGSRFAFEVLGDLALGSRLADASRANLLSAHELCAREAQSRPRNPADLIAAIAEASKPRAAR